MISRIAAFHLAPTSLNRQNLVREGIPDERIYVTGNTGIDALLYAATLDIPFEDPAVEAVVESGARYVLVTAHRRENWEAAWHGSRPPSAASPKPIQACHRRAAASEPTCSPRVGGAARRPRERGLDGAAGLCTIRAADVEGDGRPDRFGGIQEEAPALGVPVLVARESTERSEGIAAGTLRLVGTEPDDVVAEIEALLPGSRRLMPSTRATTPTEMAMLPSAIVAALEYLAGIALRRSLWAVILPQGRPGSDGAPFGMFSFRSKSGSCSLQRDEEHDRWVGR